MKSFKIIGHPEFEKIMIVKKLKKEVNRGIFYATRKLNYIFHLIKEIFLTTSMKFCCKVEGCFTLHLAKLEGNWPSSFKDKKL